MRFFVRLLIKHRKFPKLVHVLVSLFVWQQVVDWTGLCYEILFLKKQRGCEVENVTENMTALIHRCIQIDFQDLTVPLTMMKLIWIFESSTFVSDGTNLFQSQHAIETCKSNTLIFNPSKCMHISKMILTSSLPRKLKKHKKIYP
jgi:hypothetical protein